MDGGYVTSNLFTGSVRIRAKDKNKYQALVVAAKVLKRTKGIEIDPNNLANPSASTVHWDDNTTS